MTRGVFRLAGISGVALLMAVCTPKTPPAAPGAPEPPRYPDITPVDVPAGMRAPADLRQRLDEAWRLLQADDLAGAGRVYTALLKESPDIYPAETGLGDVALASRQFQQARDHFQSALTRNARYVPALAGLADAQLGLRQDEAALATLEALVQADPSQDAAKSRLEVVRLRVVQTQLDASLRARQAGRLAESQAILDHALEIAPSSAVILRELASVETARGDLDAAETHARRALQADSGDAETSAALGAVLEAKGNFRDAADAYARAVALDPRPAWKDKAQALRSKALAAAIPDEYRAIPTAATVTRGQVAAMIGIRLGDLLNRAPSRPALVVTDARGHWAAEWIGAVVQARVMDVFPNHTFQPAATVRRSELAGIVSQLLALAAARRPDDLAAWRAARPHFADLEPAHLSYASAALAVAAGAMASQDGRFWPTRPASGAELTAALARVEQIAGR